MGGAAISLGDVPANNSLLADRIIGTSTGGECVRIDSLSGQYPTPYNTAINPTSGLGNIFPSCMSGAGVSDTGASITINAAPGLGCGNEKQDYWATWVIDPTGTDEAFSSTTSPVAGTTGYGYTAADGFGCNSSSPFIDPLNVCSNVLFPQTVPSVGSAAAPYSLNVTSSSLDGSTARYDFVFVVTPTNIMTTDMTTPTTAAEPYIPYRYFTDQDCIDPVTLLPSTNPPQTNLANPSTCMSTSSINGYGVKLHDVGTNGDPSANDPNRAGVFPVCVLQPN
ncbi:unnamed protein product [Sphagnum tenellum]